MATSSPKLSRRSSAPKKRSAVAVLLYVPNLIGYVRIALAFVGYAYAFDSLQVTLGAYLLSQALDVADGFAARALGQSSKFGAVLDMVTDRTSTACLCSAFTNDAYATGSCRSHARRAVEPAAIAASTNEHSACTLSWW